MNDYVAAYRLTAYGVEVLNVHISERFKKVPEGIYQVKISNAKNDVDAIVRATKIAKDIHNIK